MPSLCGSAEATRAWFRAFADCSVPACHPLRPRGAHRRDASRLCRRWHGLRHALTGSTLPIIPRSDSRGAILSRLLWFALATACRIARLPVGSDRDTPPAHGDFYIQASGGSVTLPAAGYDYDSDWTPLSAGLAPAGTAASFAALGRNRFIAPSGWQPPTHRPAGAWPRSGAIKRLRPTVLGNPQARRRGCRVPYMTLRHNHSTGP